MLFIKQRTFKNYVKLFPNYQCFWGIRADMKTGFKLVKNLVYI